MALLISADPIPLTESADGVLRVAGTRIPLERVVRAFLTGATPEQIVQDYEVLEIKDVYAVIAWYLHHRGEVDIYLAAADLETVTQQGEIERLFDPTGIRNRLLARRSAQAG